ncbi:hypothetical protein HY639_03075 [Candidatus Woesearchaeota archaeon]|nr:hypothetical protein [Candidatus Woesearchaeota archaeon]
MITLEKKGKCCGCQCHGLKHWVLALSFVLLGVVGLWWNEYFMTLVYVALLIHGLLCLAGQLCKCC